MSSLLPPEGQVRQTQPEGLFLALLSGLGSPLARRPQELVLPAHWAEGGGGSPHIVPEADLCRPESFAASRLGPGHFRRAFSWAPAVSGANTGMHILLYVLCFLFLDTFDFFT